MTIDQLTNRELDEAVAIRLGWKSTNNGTYWIDPDRGPKLGVHKPPSFSTDTGLAIGPLIGLGHDIDITCRGDHVSVFRLVYQDHHWTHRFELLASGPKSDLPRICCVAFLKLKGE